MFKTQEMLMSCLYVLVVSSENYLSRNEEMKHPKIPVQFFETSAERLGIIIAIR